jgi:hypothetical protein
MKLKIAIAMGVLFALAPLAAPKGAAQTLTFSVSCTLADNCAVTGSGLAASASYVLTIADSCGAVVHSTSLKTSTSGTLNVIVNGVAESLGCSSTGWTFSLATSGRKSAVVATYFASDPD